VVGIGVEPNVELAAAAGLRVGNGIVVNEYLQTSDPYIFAIGDCAEYPTPFADSPIRVESVQNAVDQARCVAACIVGQRRPYENVPWFWTDQYDVRLQMAGFSRGYDESVMRGEPETRSFSMFYFRNGRLIAVDSINRPIDHVHARRLLASHTNLSPKQVRAESLELKTLGATA
jgi:3-phenylpropionate/trans-cinnamate dioxygenase ferredoxin reductase subunit